MCLRELDVCTINKTSNSLNSIIKLGKDRLEKNDCSNIVYKVDCKNCPSSYVGQSRRKLLYRVNEHTRDVKKLSKNSSLATHVNNTNHTIDFENIKIIDSEKSYKKRLFSEMLNIQFSDHTLNRMEDTINLKNSYKNTVNLIKKYLPPK